MKLNEILTARSAISKSWNISSFLVSFQYTERPSNSMSLKEESCKFQEVEPGIQLASQLWAVRAPIVIPKAIPVPMQQFMKIIT